MPNNSRRHTKQRQVILDELAQLRSHPTADELYQRVRQRLPRVSLGTVYRNLDLLQRQGIIQRLDQAGPPMRFDAVTRSHDHVRCVVCGKVADLEPTKTGPTLGKIAARTSYHVLSVSVDVRGICPQCQAEHQWAGVVGSQCGT